MTTYRKMNIFLLLLVLNIMCVESKKAEDINDNVLEKNELIQLMPTSVIYRSTDAGKTWIPYANGIPQEATVSSFLTVNNSTYATTDAHGIYVIREGEAKWLRIDTDLPEKVDINAMSAIDRVIIIGTFKHGIFISRNGGRNWEQSVNSLNHTPIRCLLSDNDLVFAGTDSGIYKSIDVGNTWQPVFKDVQTNGFTMLNNKIYAALMNGAIMTTDRGVGWKYIYKPLTLHDISNDGEGVYAMTLGGGLLKSKNDGLTWEKVNNGLGETRWYTFEVKNTDNQLFAAQWHGIYSSTKGTNSWRIIKHGLPDSTAFTTLETTPWGLIAGIGLRKK